MKCTNGVDGVSTKEDGANVCTPNELPPKTKRLSFTADSCSQLSDMQMLRSSIIVCKHSRHKEKHSEDNFYRLWYKTQMETKTSRKHSHT